MVGTLCNKHTQTYQNYNNNKNGSQRQASDLIKQIIQAFERVDGFKMSMKLVNFSSN